MKLNIYVWKSIEMGQEWLCCDNNDYDINDNDND